SRQAPPRISSRTCRRRYGSKTSQRHGAYTRGAVPENRKPSREPRLTFLICSYNTSLLITQRSLTRLLERGAPQCGQWLSRDSLSGSVNPGRLATWRGSCRFVRIEKNWGRQCQIK